MSCDHRFLSKYREGSLLPNWKYNTLIIGTFNPSWDTPNNDADYFYSRSRNYFWYVLPNLHHTESLLSSNTSQKESFLKTNKVGLTDLIKSIKDANENNKDHYCLIKTMRDQDLAKFKDFGFNTDEIIKVINEDKVTRVFITNLNSPKIFEKEINRIEKCCKDKEVVFARLLTPSPGARFKLGKGVKIKEGLFKYWDKYFNQIK